MFQQISQQQLLQYCKTLTLYIKNIFLHLLDAREQSLLSDFVGHLLPLSVSFGSWRLSVLLSVVLLNLIFTLATARNNTEQNGYIRILLLYSHGDYIKKPLAIAHRIC